MVFFSVDLAEYIGEMAMEGKRKKSVK